MLSRTSVQSMPILCVLALLVTVVPVTRPQCMYHLEVETPGSRSLRLHFTDPADLWQLQESS